MKNEKIKRYRKNQWIPKYSYLGDRVLYWFRLVKGGVEIKDLIVN